MAAGCAGPPGSPLETWGGVTAYVFGDKRVPVYARSATDAGYEPGALGDRWRWLSIGALMLAVRYLYFERGISADWHGDDAWQMCTVHPPGVDVVGAPAVGDLMVFAANDATYGVGSEGHVAIIRTIDGDSLGLFQQRWADETTAFSEDIGVDHALCFLHAAPLQALEPD